MTLQKKNNSLEDLLAMPAVCYALPPLIKVTGQNNQGHVWSGEALLQTENQSTQVFRCVVKLLEPTTTLPIELACAMAGNLLGNDIPQPVLVWADRANLPELPMRIATEQVLLFGCAFIKQDIFFEQLAALDTNKTLDNAVWNSFCNDEKKAANGASLDEFITNFDRHTRNLRFDGKRWWLIDHDCALLQTHKQDLAVMDANFCSPINQIAQALLERRPMDHGMSGAARRAHDNIKDLSALAANAAQWRSADPELQNIWTRTAAVIALLARRLPMLELMIEQRIGNKDSNTLQWTLPPSVHRVRPAAPKIRAQTHRAPAQK